MSHSSTSFWDYEKSLRGILFKVEYALLFRDVPTGVFLSQLAFWFRPSLAGKSKVTITAEGKKWVRKTREEWCQETGLGLKQVIRAIKVLEEAGVVESRVWRHHGITTLHLHLIADRLRQLLEDPIGHFQEAPNGHFHGKSSMGVSVSTSSAFPYKTEITEESTSEITCPAGKASVELQAGSSGEEGGGNQIATDVLKGFEEEEEEEEVQLKAVKTSKTSVNSLVILWKKHASLSSIGFAKPLTGQQIGQLKHVIKVLGMKKAHEVLTFCLENWEKFSTRTAALKACPAAQVPQTGFFCQHYEIGLQLIAEAQQKKSMAEVQQKKAASAMATLSQKPTVVTPESAGDAAVVGPEAMANLLAELLAARKNKK